MFDLPSREIVHEHEFDAQLSRLIVDQESANEFIAGAEEMLAKDPRGGMPATKHGSVWYLVMAPVDGRRVSLFYTFDDHSVAFLSILPFDD